MGCEVNGPGEASHADVGLAGGRNGRMLLFASGEKIRMVDVSGAVSALVDEAGRVLRSRGTGRG
jgi:(E)-4-hydroxy-3-methylbut-2-enyl-diphosphate synthase